MGRRISFVVLVIALIISLPVFSYAVDPPAGSEILEYIESSGTQYIDTLVKYDSSNYNKLRLVSENLYPSFTNDSSKWSINGSAYSGGAVFYYGVAHNGSVWFGNGSDSQISKTLSVNTRYSWDYNAVSGTYLLDGSVLKSGISFSVPRGSPSLLLFGYHSSGTSIVLHPERVYNFDIYQSGLLLRDYVPLRYPDGRVGLWDYVDGTFFPNVGTGTFTAGPVVEVVDPSFSITVETDGNGSAEASVDKALEGEKVTLTATPADGYIFSGWEVVSGDVTISNNQFVMPAEDVVIKATFTDDPNIFSITVSSDGNGTASSSVVSAEQGAQISLTATPNAGYQLKQWNVLSGGVTVSNDSFTMPAAVI